MEDRIIENWNELVHPGDTIYHLGDFALTWGTRDREGIERLLRRLNGSKQLICGNHDRSETRDVPGWSWVGDYKRAKIDGQWIIMLHYCLRSWHGMHRGWWHLYGHSHGNLKDDGGGKCMDVGVDCHNFRPIEFSDIRKFMEGRENPQVDHHV